MLPLLFFPLIHVVRVENAISVVHEMEARHVMKWNGGNLGVMSLNSLSITKGVQQQFIPVPYPSQPGASLFWSLLLIRSSFLWFSAVVLCLLCIACCSLHGAFTLQNHPRVQVNFITAQHRLMCPNISVVLRCRISPFLMASLRPKWLCAHKLQHRVDKKKFTPTFYRITLYKSI